MRKKAKQIYGILLSMSMLITLLSVPVWAAEPVETGAGYEQEQEQQQEQEQEQKQIQEQEHAQEQEEGQAQNPEHEHTEACYMLTENCVHEHTLECYPQTTGAGTVSGNDIMEVVEAQPTACTHVCSEESGCISRRLSCPFEKESSGELQEETLEGSSGINVENALKANELPIVKAPNNNGVTELNQNTIMNYRRSGPYNVYYVLPSGDYRLEENITLDGELKIGEISTSAVVSLDLNGYKMEMGNNVLSILSSSELAIKNTNQEDGKLIDESECGIRINYGAKLRIYGGTIDCNITYNAAAELYLYGGTIKRNIRLESDKEITNTVIYANGGTVEGDLEIPNRDALTIRMDEDPRTSTIFMGAVRNSRIESGIFKGSVHNCTIAETAMVIVRFDSNGGNEIFPREISLLRGREVWDPGTPVYDGYVFEGWIVNGNPYEIWNFSDSVTRNMELRAMWKAVYKVILNTNNGTIAAGKEIKSYIERTQTALPTKDDITREGYTFEGWYTDSSFSGSPVTEITSSDTGDKTFYAKWSANIYIVKLETNGGKIADGKDVTAYTCGIGAALPGVGDIIREGYTFEGWYTDSSFSGSPVTEITSSDTGNKTFYAKWKQNTAPVTPGETEHNTSHNNTDYYNTGDTNESSDTAPVIYPTLTFDTCGGSSIKAVHAFEGHTLNLSDYLPIREGYEFGGWYADQITEDQATEDQSTEDTGDNQKTTADNSPADNDSKPDDGANLSSEDNSHSGGWIPVVCASTGALVIGSGLYLEYRKRKKIKIDKK
jgi:uncharacterized repeat protein (TIGR02543 family)